MNERQSDEWIGHAMPMLFGGVIGVVLLVLVVLWFFGILGGVRL